MRNTKGISKGGRNTVPDVKLGSAQQNEKHRNGINKDILFSTYF